MDIARITPQDVIVDMGAGDGRVLVYAALNIGCRGIGIEISSECLDQARRIANDYRVAHMVTFVEADLTSETLDIEVDMSQATVFILYFYKINELKQVIERLRSRNPSARFVTLRFG